MTFKSGDSVIYAQLDLLDDGLVGLRGIVVKAAREREKNLYEVNFDGAGNHIVEGCCLELQPVLHG